MNLLALETATQTCGVALLREDEIVAEAHLHIPRVHSERCTPLVEEILDHADLSPSALDAVAVSMGPGSYTGLRIGVSTAKGWALAADADLVGVPTFEAYAAQLRPYARPSDVVCVMFDARRDEVYAGAYRVTAGALDVHAETTALTVADVPDWLGSVPGPLWVLGNGAEKCQDALDGIGAHQTVIPVSERPPSAVSVARCGAHRLRTDGPDDLDSFEPLYVKEVHATPAPSPFG